MSSDWTIKTNPASQASFTLGPHGCCSSCVACLQLECMKIYYRKNYLSWQHARWDVL